MSKRKFIESKTIKSPEVDVTIKVDFDCPMCGNSLEFEANDVNAKEDVYCDQCDHWLESIEVERLLSDWDNYQDVKCDVYKIEASCAKCHPDVGGEKIPACLDCRIKEEQEN